MSKEIEQTQSAFDRCKPLKGKGAMVDMDDLLDILEPLIEAVRNLEKP